MPTFNTGDLSLWMSVPLGQALEVVVPDGGVRTVAFDVMCDDHTSVKAVVGDDVYLVGAGVGMFSCKFSVRETVHLIVDATEGSTVAIRSERPLAVVRGDALSHTRIEPRQRGMSSDLMKIAHIMRLNSERREAAMRAELDALRARLDGGA